MNEAKGRGKKNSYVDLSSGRKWLGWVPLFDPSGGWVVRQPLGEGKGNWAGAPSAFYDEEEGRFFLSYRLRKPLTQGRGYLTCISESKDGKEFNDIWSGKATEFNSPSIERSALIKTPEGRYRLYVSYVEALDNRWRIDMLEADHPSRFDPTRRQPVLRPDDVDSEGVKDPYVILIGGMYYMYVPYEPRGFEPAPTLKTLHHVMTMRRVSLGTYSLGQNVTVNTSMNGSCPTDSNPVGETLEVVLGKMMNDSDNARTKAITTLLDGGNATTGLIYLTNSAASLGMTGTDVNHHIGCGTPANVTTLVDLGKLHEQVINGYLGAQRQKFYDIMMNTYQGGGYALGRLGTVVDQEAASVGLSASQEAAFRSYFFIAGKRGGYGVDSRYHHTWAGYFRVPFYSVTQGVSFQEYVGGAFMYLPMELNTPILSGAFVTHWIGKSSSDEAVSKSRSDKGILIASGLIAGAAILGVVKSLLLSVDSGARFVEALNISRLLGGEESSLFNALGIVAFLVLCVLVYADCRRTTTEAPKTS